MDVNTFINKYDLKNKTKTKEHLKYLLNTLPKHKPLHNYSIY